MIDVAKHKWKVLAGFTAVFFFFDWYTKHLAVTHLTKHRPVSVLGETLEWYLTYNKGALFSFNPKDFISWFPTNEFFFVFSIIAMTGLIIFFKYLEKEATLVHWAVSLILPGAMGNLFDRIVRPGEGVVDFIKVDFNIWMFDPWPIFNIADSCIFVGICLILTDVFFFEKKRELAKQAVLAETNSLEPKKEISSETSSAIETTSLEKENTISSEETQNEAPKNTEHKRTEQE